MSFFRVFVLLALALPALSTTCVPECAIAACDDATKVTDCPSRPTCLTLSCVNHCCTYTPNNAACTDSRTCTIDKCDPLDAQADTATGCVSRPDSTACNDFTQSCIIEVCNPSAAGASTSSGCVGICRSEKCAHDGNPCTQETCSKTTAGATGCSTTPLTSGSCDDCDPCTTGDHCSAGACVGTAVSCSPPDLCHNPGTCDSSTGQCVYTPKANVLHLTITLHACTGADNPSAILVSVDASGNPDGTYASSQITLTKSGCTFTADLPASLCCSNFAVKVFGVSTKYFQTAPPQGYFLSSKVTFTDCAASLCLTGDVVTCRCPSPGALKNSLTCSGNPCVPSGGKGCADDAIIGSDGTNVIIGNYQIPHTSSSPGVATACNQALFFLTPTSLSGNIGQDILQMVAAEMSIRQGQCQSSSTIPVSADIQGYCGFSSSTASVFDVITCNNALLSSVNFNCNFANNPPCTWGSTSGVDTLLGSFQTFFHNYNADLNVQCPPPIGLTPIACSA